MKKLFVEQHWPHRVCSKILSSLFLIILIGSRSLVGFSPYPVPEAQYAYIILLKNMAYGRQRIYWLVRLVAPIK